MSALELMKKSLTESMYHEITDREEMDEDSLGSKEFFVVRVGHQEILCLGEGHSGDTGCKVKFYFVDGKLMGHAALAAEED